MDAPRPPTPRPTTPRPPTPEQQLLDHQVAEAAQAWLDDPRDAGVYARLVLAVESRRRQLAEADRERADALTGGDLTDVAPDVLAEPADGDVEPPVDPARLVVRAVGDELAGDPAAVLRRLRGLG